MCVCLSFVYTAYKGLYDQPIKRWADFLWVLQVQLLHLLQVANWRKQHVWQQMMTLKDNCQKGPNMFHSKCHKVWQTKASCNQTYETLGSTSISFFVQPQNEREQPQRDLQPGGSYSLLYSAPFLLSFPSNDNKVRSH